MWTARVLPLIGVDLTYRVGVKVIDRLARRRPGADATLDAQYCVRVWRRHEPAAGDAQRLVELGPGASLGVGIAGVVGGANEYIGLDSVERASPVIDASLAAAIASELGLDLPTDLGSRIHYLAPWTQDAVAESSVDAVISQAVMEHVADIDAAYGAIARWLRPGGKTSHQVDFRSHAISPWWNGQWQYPDDLWARLRPRSDPINRQPLSAHVFAIERAGLRLTRLEVDRRTHGVRRWQLADRFRGLSDEDLAIASAFIQAERPGM